MVSNKKQDLQSLGVGPTYSELHSKSISKLEYTLGSRSSPLKFLQSFFAVTFEDGRRLFWWWLKQQQGDKLSFSSIICFMTNIPFRETHNTVNECFQKSHRLLRCRLVPSTLISPAARTREHQPFGNSCIGPLVLWLLGRKVP